MLPPAGRDYLLAALENSPPTAEALLFGAGPDVWDLRPDPERFSVREIVAHLADWEDVWRERFRRTANEDRPRLTRPILPARIEEKGYASADPAECLSRLRAKRAENLAWLRALPEEAWDRTAHLDRLGETSLAGLIGLALGHDSYHLRQVAEWLAGRL